MVQIAYPISKEDFDKASKEGAESIISAAEQMGYGVYRAKVYELNGKYWLTYDRGSSCD